MWSMKGEADGFSHQYVTHGSAAPIITCPNCGCEYLYNFSDIKTTKNEDGTEVKEVTCPECKTETEIQ